MSLSEGRVLPGGTHSSCSGCITQLPASWGKPPPHLFSLCTQGMKDTLGMEREDDGEVALGVGFP